MYHRIAASVTVDLGAVDRRRRRRSGQHGRVRGAIRRQRRRHADWAMPNNVFDGDAGNDTIDATQADTVLGGAGNEASTPWTAWPTRSTAVTTRTRTTPTATTPAPTACQLRPRRARWRGAARPPQPPPLPLKVMAVTVSYGYVPKFPKKTTTFFAFTAKNVPKGSSGRGAVRTAKGKKCKGKLGKSTTIKKTTKKTIALKSLSRKYPAGRPARGHRGASPGSRPRSRSSRSARTRSRASQTRCRRRGRLRRTAC